MRTLRRTSAERPNVRMRRRLRSLKSVPVLPSMVTLGNLFFGFLAMSKAADAVVRQGSGASLAVPVLELFETAALLVFLAMVFDGLDGAVARITHQTSPFGTQLDSLADVVTFGVAPAFIAKMIVDFHARPEVGLLPLHQKLYWAAAAIYVLCAAMRLARYNAEGGSPDDEHKEFAGLPSPAAAAVVCSLIAFLATRADQKATLSSRLFSPQTYDALCDTVVQMMPPLLVVLGLLMVSRFPYPHLVATLVRGRHSFPFLATMVVLVFAVAIEWQFALAALSLAYVGCGILLGALRLVTRGRMDEPGGDGGDDSDGDEAAAGDASDSVEPAPLRERPHERPHERLN